MNKKGFTLTELLATIVVLSLVTGIAVVAVMGSLNNAKRDAEKEYLNQLSNAVDAYMTMCLGGYNESKNSCGEFKDFSPEVFGTFTKGTENNTREVSVFESGTSGNFNKIVNEGILGNNDLINPVNNENCGDGAKITFYRDDDYVYYYKIELPSTCIRYTAEGENSNEISTLLPIVNEIGSH